MKNLELEKIALAWWERLSLTNKQNITYHYCTCNEISTMEFEIHHIVESYQKNQVVLQFEKLEKNVDTNSVGLLEWSKSYMPNIGETVNEFNEILTVDSIEFKYGKTYIRLKKF